MVDAEGIAHAARRDISTEPDLAESARDGRHETPSERYDRNWIEVLQELRVLQTGTQILTGFLLALAFQPAFADLDEGQRAFYLFLVVALHRFLFRRREKGLIVTYGHAALITALATVSILLVGVVAFVFDVVLDRGAAQIAGISLAALIMVLWVVLPLIWRSRGEEPS